MIRTHHISFLYVSLTTLSLFAALFLSATKAEAMSATKAAMIELDSTHTAYVLTYEFNIMNYSLIMPGTAVRTGSSSPITTLPPLLYTLRDTAGAEVKSGLSVSTVMSSLPMADGVFKTATSTPSTFTLVVVHTHDVTDQATHLTVDQLPFFLVNNAGETTLSSVPTTTRATYTTKSITESSYIRYPIN